MISIVALNSITFSQLKFNSKPNCSRIYFLKKFNAKTKILQNIRKSFSWKEASRTLTLVLFSDKSLFQKHCLSYLCENYVYINTYVCFVYYFMFYFFNALQLKVYSQRKFQLFFPTFTFFFTTYMYKERQNRNKKKQEICVA